MRRALILALLLAVGVCSGAQAKGPVPAEACGASGCERTTLEILPSDLVLPPDFMEGGQDYSTPPAERAPWFGVRFRLADNRGRVDDRCQTVPRPYFCDPVRRVVVLADGSYVGGDDPSGEGLIWRKLSGAEAGVYLGLTGGLEPFPAATIPGLPQPAPAGDGPWLWLLAGVAVLAVLAAAGIARRRSRRADAAPHGVASPSS